MLMMEDLGCGINIGNDLDCYGAASAIENPTVRDYETFWNNPPVKKEIISALKKAGFKTIRIPVSWSEHIGADGSVDEAWMSRVQEVVDWVIEEDLYAVLDVHHEDFIAPTYEKEEEVSRKLESLWRQIGERFAEYDEHLLFEGMNEPRLENSAEEWTAGTKEMRDVVNHLNGVFVKTVRSLGGKNKRRFLLIQSYGPGFEEEALKALEIPEGDTRVMVAVHAYLPYRFTEANEGHETWKEDKARYTEDIQKLKQNIKTLFLDKGIPVVITEYGCEEKKYEEQRIAWAKYYLNAFSKDLGVPCLWWDNGAEYAVYDRESGAITREGLVKVLTGRE
ncbi:MAG: glycoside hydrolase family 5 protein [Lachnospiraceae bacterium]|nr:glycoside hydrolase family 5 protein [Lachnospiraceae bacterium]